MQKTLCKAHPSGEVNPGPRQCSAESTGIVNYGTRHRGLRLGRGGRGSMGGPCAGAGLGPVRGLSSQGPRGAGGRGSQPGLRCLGHSLLLRAQGWNPSPVTNWGTVFSPANAKMNELRCYKDPEDNGSLPMHRFLICTVSILPKHPCAYNIWASY